MSKVQPRSVNWPAPRSPLKVKPLRKVTLRGGVRAVLKPALALSSTTPIQGSPSGGLGVVGWLS